MGTKEKLIIVAMMILSGFASAQDTTSRYVHKGLLRASSTFTIGMFFENGLSAAYLSGNAEYYFHDNASVRGDGYYFMGHLGKEKIFTMNHSFNAGISWHIPTKNHLDPYIFFQPGVTLAESWEKNPCMCAQVDTMLHSSMSLDPLISGGTGVNLYFQKIFHIFAEVRFTQGNHQSNYPSRSLSDMRFSFGLGWNIL